MDFRKNLRHVPVVKKLTADAHAYGIDVNPFQPVDPRTVFQEKPIKLPDIMPIQGEGSYKFHSIIGSGFDGVAAIYGTIPRYELSLENPSPGEFKRNTIYLHGQGDELQFRMMVAGGIATGTIHQHKLAVRPLTDKNTKQNLQTVLAQMSPFLVPEKSQVVLKFWRKGSIIDSELAMNEQIRAHTDLNEFGLLITLQRVEYPHTDIFGKLNAAVAFYFPENDLSTFLSRVSERKDNVGQFFQTHPGMFCCQLEHSMYASMDKLHRAHFLHNDLALRNMLFASPTQFDANGNVLQVMGALIDYTRTCRGDHMDTPHITPIEFYDTQALLGPKKITVNTDFFSFKFSLMHAVGITLTIPHVAASDLSLLDNGHHYYLVAPISKEELKPNAVEFNCDKNGIHYRLMGLDNKLREGLIKWKDAPEHFPKINSEVFEIQEQCLPVLMNAISRKEKGQTPLHDSDPYKYIPNRKERFQNYLKARGMVEKDLKTDDFRHLDQDILASYFKNLMSAITLPRNNEMKLFLACFSEYLTTMYTNTEADNQAFDRARYHFMICCVHMHLMENENVLRDDKNPNHKQVMADFELLIKRIPVAHFPDLKSDYPEDLPNSKEFLEAIKQMTTREAILKYMDTEPAKRAMAMTREVLSTSDLTLGPVKSESASAPAEPTTTTQVHDQTQVAPMPKPKVLSPGAQYAGTISENKVSPLVVSSQPDQAQASPVSEPKVPDSSPATKEVKRDDVATTSTVVVYLTRLPPEKLAQMIRDKLDQPHSVHTFGLAVYLNRFLTAVGINLSLPETQSPTEQFTQKVKVVLTYIATHPPFHAVAPLTPDLRKKYGVETAVLQQVEPGTLSTQNLWNKSPSPTAGEEQQATSAATLERKNT